MNQSNRRLELHILPTFASCAACLPLLLLSLLSGQIAPPPLAAYVLSRAWHDLLSIYVFRLHPVPHCSETLSVQFSTAFSYAGPKQDECIEEAPTWQLVRYALGLLLVLSSVQAAAIFVLQRQPHITWQIMAIAGMCVAEAHTVHALYLICTHPVHSWIHASRCPVIQVRRLGHWRCGGPNGRRPCARRAELHRPPMDDNRLRRGPRLILRGILSRR